MGQTPPVLGNLGPELNQQPIVGNRVELETALYRGGVMFAALQAGIPPTKSAGH
jgi:hypothetical protein